MTPKPQMPLDIFASTSPREEIQRAPVESPRVLDELPARRPKKVPANSSEAWKATQVRFDPKTAEILGRWTGLARHKGLPGRSNSALIRMAVAKMDEAMTDKEIVAQCPVPTRITVIQ